MSPAEKLKNRGIDPIVPLPLCAEATGLSQQTLKTLARRGEFEIVRVSERRAGIRQSVLNRFLDSRVSAT